MASAMRVNLCPPRVLGVVMSRVVGWFNLSAMLTPTSARCVPLDSTYPEVRMGLGPLRQEIRNAVQLRHITGLFPVVFLMIRGPFSSQTCAVEVRILPKRISSQPCILSGVFPKAAGPDFGQLLLFLIESLLICCPKAILFGSSTSRTEDVIARCDKLAVKRFLYTPLVSSISRHSCSYAQSASRLPAAPGPLPSTISQ